MITLSIFSILFAAVISVPVLTLLAEILAALTVRFPGTDREVENRCGRMAILVPAHNESHGMLATLEDIRTQMRTGDQLLVVADNCTDDTAAVAARAGATVISRVDLTRIGKGFALDFGVRHLASDPPDIVVIVDADCRLEPSALRQLGSACALTRRPIQGLNLMVAPVNSPRDYRVSTFAFRVKNLVRPLGLSAMKLPCALTGTGMALPWELLARANLASASIVEDMKLGLELSEAGHAPLFCPAARIVSHFPSSFTAATGQRRRWERGHLGIVAKRAPSMAARAIARGNISMLAAALDAAVPPIIVLGLAIALSVATAAIIALCGGSITGLDIALAVLLSFIAALVLAWAKFGRDILPVAAIPSLARYLVDKLPLYRSVLAAKRGELWVRTDRDIATVTAGQREDAKLRVIAGAASHEPP